MPDHAFQWNLSTMNWWGPQTISLIMEVSLLNTSTVVNAASESESVLSD